MIMPRGVQRLEIEISLALHVVRYIREFTYDHNDEASLAKELVLQVRKVIGPFAAPKNNRPYP
jgi:hypothetical protein